MRSYFTVGAILMSLLVSIPGRAETGSTLSLVSNSPFLPPGFQPPGTPGTPFVPPVSSSQFEFRGVYQLGDTYYYNLYDVSKRKASWLTAQNADEMNLSIVSFDAEENELALSINGSPVSLPLMETSDRVLPVDTAPATQPATSVVQPGTTAAQPTANQPVRRRVIRPTGRNRSSPSDSTARRPVIRPTR